ncbi:putative golgi SnaRE [Cardiosporidium cionae]|uniref:Golgi SnaRE n=1 Tax=Cardiosporidium cionae TaxID=476202 RepID=A0ABQ7JEM8_9APIC|nr:putative golgi SnaRE [Cardiosporidium cionae]|eukprot:KAF8822462.1 putative golgi SnaRE [Cardiosporidium cionae]
MQTEESLSTLYPQALQQRKEIDTLLEIFEGEKAYHSVALQQRLSALNKELNRSLERLQNLFGEKRASFSHSECNRWKHRLQSLSEDCTNLRISLEKQLGQLYKVEADHTERQKLFQGGSTIQKRANRTGTQQLLQEQQTLKEVDSVLDSITEQGGHIVKSLFTQNRTVSGTFTRLKSIADSVGLTGTLSRSILRRHFVDRMLIIGGILVIVLFLIMWWWLRHSCTFI